MAWYVNNGSKLIRPHYIGSVRSHKCTTSVAYHSFYFRKTACQKYFFQILSQKMLGLWISKIWIWIWSEESTLSVDFMDSWSVFGFAQKNAKSLFGFRNPDLDFPKKTHPQPVLQGPVSLVRQLECKSIFLKGDIKKTPTRVIFSWLAWKFLERVDWMS